MATLPRLHVDIGEPARFGKHWAWNWPCFRSPIRRQTLQMGLQYLASCRTNLGKIIFLISFGAFGTSIAVDAQPLPGTAPLAIQGDMASNLVAGVDRFLLRRTAESIGSRARFGTEITPPRRPTSVRSKQIDRDWRKSWVFATSAFRP